MGVKGKSGRPCKYPWDTWLKKGKVTYLQQGKDFDGYARSFIGSIYRAASNRGKSVHIDQISNTKIVLTCL